MTTMPSPLNEIEFVLVSTFPLHLQTDLKSIIFFIVTFSNLCHSNWFVQNWPCDNWSEASQLPPWNLFQFQSICLTSRKDLSKSWNIFSCKTIQLTLSQNCTEASNVSPWALFHFQAILQHQLNFYSSKIASLCDNQQLISSKYAQGISFHVQSWPTQI